MTDLEDRFRDWILKIPKGKVCSYTGIASLAGAPGAARAVGSYLAKDSSGLPYLRVVGNSGALAANYPGGPSAQRRALEAEGVTFVGHRVDMARHAWRPAT